MSHPGPGNHPWLVKADEFHQFHYPENALCAHLGSGTLASLQRHTWSSRATVWRQMALSGKEVANGDNSGREVEGGDAGVEMKSQTRSELVRGIVKPLK